MKRIERVTLIAGAVGLCTGLLLAVVIAVSVWSSAETEDADSDDFATTSPVPQPAPLTRPMEDLDDEDKDEDEKKEKKEDGSGLDLTPGVEADAAPGEAQLPESTPLQCPPATVEVSTADELTEALAGARPGDVIGLAAGVYLGHFVAESSGTKEQRIYLCGGSDAILDGGAVGGGYVMHLDEAKYWALIGFTVRNGQKGVMADGTTGSYIQSLTVTRIGDEAIHLRNHSVENVVLENTISDTGLRRPKFGEGIYIGSAKSNWCDITDCKPDRSDRNVIRGNTISGTASESIDLKEGTTHGLIIDNTFDGSSISAADSWVDVKGTAWTIENNIGRNSPGDGFQTHEILEGWGTRNIFRNNTAAVNGPGLGYALRPPLENVVSCNNTASGAAEGRSNIDCE